MRETYLTLGKIISWQIDERSALGHSVHHQICLVKCLRATLYAKIFLEPTLLMAPDNHQNSSPVVLTYTFSSSSQSFSCDNIDDGDKYYAYDPVWIGDISFYFIYLFIYYFFFFCQVNKSSALSVLCCVSNENIFAFMIFTQFYNSWVCRLIENLPTQLISPLACTDHT